MVKLVTRVPRRGDVVWLNFDPQSGREQAGRRPAVVLSHASYYSRSGLALVCPVTRRVKGYPFEVPLPPRLPVEGVVLADHLRSLDWQTRESVLICKLPADSLAELSARIIPLLDPER